MGWIEKRKLNEPPHTCSNPWYEDIQREGLDVGSIWECHICKTRWRYDGLDFNSNVISKVKWTRSYPK